MKFPPLFFPQAYAENAYVSSQQRSLQAVKHVRRALAKREKEGNTEDFSLDLTGYPAENKHWLEITHLLKKNHNFRELRLQTTQINLIAIELMADILMEEKRDNFISWEMRGISMEYGGGSYRALSLMLFLENNEKLERLSLTDCLYFPWDARLCLGHLKSLAVLDLSDNCLGDHYGAGFIEKLPGGLRSFSFAGNKLAIATSRSIARHLNKNLLTSLDLSHNCFCDESMLFLAEALSKNHSLLKINLSNNKITKKGASLLASALTVNQSLSYLNCGENDLGNAGALAFKKILLKNSGLTELDLSKTKMGRIAYLSFQTLPKSNYTFLRIHCGYNPIGFLRWKEKTIFFPNNIALYSNLARAIEKKDLESAEVLIKGGISLCGREGLELFDRAVKKSWYAFLDILYAKNIILYERLPFPMEIKNFPRSFEVWKIPLPDVLTSIVFSYLFAQPSRD